MTTVIKAGDTGKVLRRLSTVDLADHLAEADALLAAARRQAQQLLAHAQQKADAMNSEAHQRGYDDGYKKGIVEGARVGREQAHEEAVQRFAQEQESVVAGLQRSVREVDRIKKDLSIEAEKDLLDFAVYLASKLTFAIGRLHRDAARENFRRALRLVGSRTDLTLLVHPDDVDSIKTFAPSVLDMADTSHALRIVEDESIDPGGCLVRTERTTVDTTLRTQVDELVALLLGTASRTKPATASETGDV